MDNPGSGGDAMRNGSTKARRADLRRVRQDVLILLEEQEARITKAPAPEEKTAPAQLSTIARQMLDAIGGGSFTIHRKGMAPTIQQRAQELAEEEQRRLKLRW